MSIAESVRISDLEASESSTKEELRTLRALVERTIANIQSLAVRAAIERPPFDIPPPPACLYQLGLVQ